MKITLKNYDASALFSAKERKENAHNGVHACMSGARYVVDAEQKTLEYEGGLSPMFTHGDFPVGDGISCSQKSLKLLSKVTAFEVTYSDQTCPKQTQKTLKFDFANPDKVGLERFAAHTDRIAPNSWECDGKTAMLALIEHAKKACRKHAKAAK